MFVNVTFYLRNDSFKLNRFSNDYLYPYLNYSSCSITNNKVDSPLSRSPLKLKLFLEVYISFPFLIPYLLNSVPTLIFVGSLHGLMWTIDPYFISILS